MSDLLIEWNRTGKAARIAIILLVTLMVGICVCSTISYLANGNYEDAKWTFPTLVIFLLWKVVYPFCLAAGARKRGGSFGAWFVGAMFLGIIIMLLLYWLSFRKKPILPEYQTAPISSGGLAE